MNILCYTWLIYEYSLLYLANVWIYSAHTLCAVRPNITGISRSVNGSVGPGLFHEGMLLLEEFTSQLKLTCEAYGLPPPDVVWLRNGIALQNITGKRAITVEDGGSLDELGNLTRSTLIFSEVQLSDAGEYTCRASSGNVSPIPGTTAWTFMLNITGELLIYFIIVHSDPVLQEPSFKYPCPWKNYCTKIHNWMHNVQWLFFLL